MESKLRQLAGALWCAAEASGKAGKRLERDGDAAFAIGCYVHGGARTLRLGRQGVYPGLSELAICRNAFDVTPAAASRSYVTPGHWHVVEFTWSLP